MSEIYPIDLDILIPLLLTASDGFFDPVKRLAVSFVGIPGAAEAVAAARVIAPPLLARRTILVVSGDGNW